MAYDTIKLKSPPLLPWQIQHIERQCMRRTGEDMASGEILYELFSGQLLGSWDSRISVQPKHEDFVVNDKGRPVLTPCEPYLLIEASVHKVFQGHNVYGGPTDFQKVCADFVQLLEGLLRMKLPSVGKWTVHRVDVAEVFRVTKEGCKEFFDGMQLINFPRRKRGSAKYDMAAYFAGKTTTVKFYHKGTEFKVHERSRLRTYFMNLFTHQDALKGRAKEEGRGFRNDKANSARAERKVEALQRLADSRLRAEVEIHSDKFQYDFGKNPRVDEVTDAYLQQVYDEQIEKLLREGKQGMDTVRDSKAVMRRLKSFYGDENGNRLHGFWSLLAQHGDEYARQQYPKASFYRHRKHLEKAGVSWRGSDVVVVANDGALPHDFSPIRSDKRLCFRPARNREEFNVSREMMRLAA